MQLALTGEEVEGAAEWELYDDNGNTVDHGFATATIAKPALPTTPQTTYHLLIICLLICIRKTEQSSSERIYLID